MEEKERGLQNLSQSELHLIRRLRKQPKIMERVQRILEIANSSEGPPKTADEIEELLLEEMRRLGNDTMTEWATQAEERVGRELQKEDPTVLKCKKNANLVVQSLARSCFKTRSGAAPANLTCARCPDVWG